MQQYSCLIPRISNTAAAGVQVVLQLMCHTTYQLQEVTRGYKRLQEVARGCKRLQEVTRGYKSLQELTRAYKSLQERVYYMPASKGVYYIRLCVLLVLVCYYTLPGNTWYLVGKYSHNHRQTWQLEIQGSTIAITAREPPALLITDYSVIIGNETNPGFSLQPSQGNATTPGVSNLTVPARRNLKRETRLRI